MSFDSLLPLEYFFSPGVRTKQTFSSGFPIWNIPIWSKGYTRSRYPWYEQNLYTDLDRSWEEAHGSSPTVGEMAQNFMNVSAAVGSSVLDAQEPYREILIEFGLKRLFPGRFIMYEELPPWVS